MLKASLKDSADPAVLDRHSSKLGASKSADEDGKERLKALRLTGYRPVQSERTWPMARSSPLRGYLKRVRFSDADEIALEMAHLNRTAFMLSLVKQNQATRFLSSAVAHRSQSSTVDCAEP